MERLGTAVASLVGVVAIICVIVTLAISSYTDRPALPLELCNDLVQCDIVRQPSTLFEGGKAPTLAPRRSDAPSTADSVSQKASLAQPVYVQVKTDHADIEVGWASGEFLGR
jgi:hypothetical protein